jgi:hypothetical protein
MLVDRMQPGLVEESAFEACLDTLCQDVLTARRLGLAAHARASQGPLSIRARDAVLETAYQECFDHPGQTALSLDQLPYYRDAGYVWTGDDASLKAQRRAYCESIGVRSELVYIAMEMDPPEVAAAS